MSTQMDFIPIEFQQQYKQVLDYINAYKNGVTSDGMKKHGIVYEKNYGVAMPDLRKIADRFRKSRDFAELLWRKGWRETYILSTLLDEPEKYSAELLAGRVDQAPTYELLEQIAYNLAWQIPDLDAYFAQANDKDGLNFQFFLIKCTMYQMMNKVLDNAAAWERIKQYSFADNTSLLSTLQNLLLRITAQQVDLHKEVVAYCQKHESEAWQRLTEVIREYGL